MSEEEELQPTWEQDAIVQAALTQDNNLQIVAYAGTGKTSTLEMVDYELQPGPRLYLAFNKKVVDEMTKPDKDGHTRLRKTTDCRTINSLGHRVWAKTIAERISLNRLKTIETFREIVGAKSRDEAEHLWDYYDEIKTMVDLAKSVGYIPMGMPHYDRGLISRDDFLAPVRHHMPASAIEAAEEILKRSIRLAYKGVIDFNDQAYMPALFGGSYPFYPTVFVDEYQDLSPVNHEMVGKLVRERIIGVGDPFQSIYQFRGAMTDGMRFARESFEMAQLPLSISFRCPSRIVLNARWRAPGFQWFRAGGSVANLLDLAIADISDGAAIICRNNAPLFRLAIRLLTSGRSVSMAGTDIGPKLLGILRRLGDESMGRSAVLSAIDDWHAKRSDSPTASDMADCLRVFANLAPTLGSAIAHAEHLFKQDGSIRLSTGHKAKGLEWHTVYHLDPGLLRADEQDLNLKYVIQTRSADRYYEVNSEDIHA